MYKVQTEIKARLKAAGIVVREVAQWLEEPPATVASRLSGYMPLPEEIKSKIIQ